LETDFIDLSGHCAYAVRKEGSVKTIWIHQFERICPDCSWKPVSVEGSARYGELIYHVMKFHGMVKPILKDRTIFVTGHGEQTCEVAIFISSDCLNG
jgi:hypothetical protein